MTLPLLTLIACSGGADIPREPGTFSDEASLRAAWLPASPDNLMTALVLRHADSSFLGDCPSTTTNELELSFDGDCEGDYGETWHGSATVREAEDHMDFFDFGLTHGGTTWILDGELDWVFPDLTEPDEQVDADYTLTWTDGTTSLTASADLRFLLDWNSGSPRLLWTEGEIGVGGWGTAELTTEILDLGTANACSYPTSGALTLVGENTGVIAFDGTGCSGECPEGTVGGTHLDDLCTGSGLPQLVTPTYSDEDPTGTLE